MAVPWVAPIIKNKLFFFVDYEATRRSRARHLRLGSHGSGAIDMFNRRQRRVAIE